MSSTYAIIGQVYQAALPATGVSLASIAAVQRSGILNLRFSSSVPGTLYVNFINGESSTGAQGLKEGPAPLITPTPGQNPLAVAPYIAGQHYSPSVQLPIYSGEQPVFTFTPSVATNGTYSLVVGFLGSVGSS